MDGKVEGEELSIASVVFHLGHWMIVTISKNFGQNLLGWIQVQPNSIKIETYMSVSTARWSGTGDTNTLHFGLNRMVNWFIYGTFPEEHQAWEGSDTHGTTVQIIHIYIQLAGNSNCPQMAHGKTKEKLVWSHQREGVNSPLVVDISYKLSTGEGIKEQTRQPVPPEHWYAGTSPPWVTDQRTHRLCR